MSVPLGLTIGLFPWVQVFRHKGGLLQCSPNQSLQYWPLGGSGTRRARLPQTIDLFINQVKKVWRHSTRQLDLPDWRPPPFCFPKNWKLASSHFLCANPNRSKNITSTSLLIC
jgi:hypothetical protein